VRARTLQLPEASGARQGLTLACAKSGQAPLRLLIVGDSSAAGVGAATQDDALAGRLARALVRHTGRDVDWALVARTGHTSAQALLALAALPGMTPVDLAVTALGVNDATGRVSPRRWLAELDAVAALLQQRTGAQFVLHCAVPPMQHFALLPQPLRWWMGQQATRLNSALAAHLRSLPGRDMQALPVQLQAQAADLMAPDGFHPGPAGYAAWAEVLAERLARAHGELGLG